MNELRLIQHAIALGKHRNFACAAEALGLTQPSLSRGIAALERALGVPLFDRTRHGVIPTVYGRLLLERGPAILQGEAGLRREMRLMAGLEGGSLSVGAGPLASETSVCEAVARMASRHPRLHIRCEVGDPDEVSAAVLSGRLDVGVARIWSHAVDARLLVETLPPLRVYLACRPGHPLTRAARPTWRDAMAYPMAANVLDGVHAVAVRTGDGEIVAAPADSPDHAPQYVVNAPALGRRIARGSDVLVPGTARMLEDDVALGHLVRLPIRAGILRTVHGIYYLRDRTLAPAAQAFIAILREVEAEALRAETASESTLRLAASRGRPRRSARG